MTTTAPPETRVRRRFESVASHPLGIVVVLVAALVGGGVVFWKHSERTHYLVDETGNPIVLTSGEPITLPSDCTSLVVGYDSLRETAIRKLAGVVVMTNAEKWEQTRAGFLNQLEHVRGVAETARAACQQSAKSSTGAAGILSRVLGGPDEHLNAETGRALWGVLAIAGQAVNAIPDTIRLGPDSFPPHLGGRFGASLATALSDECRRPLPDRARGFMVTERGDPLPSIGMLLESSGRRTWRLSDDYGCFEFSHGDSGVYGARFFGPLEAVKVRGRSLRRLSMIVSVFPVVPGVVDTVRIPESHFDFDSIRLRR